MPSLSFSDCFKIGHVQECFSKMRNHTHGMHTKRGFVVVYLLNCVWLFCNSMDCSPPSSSAHGISQVRILKYSSPGNLPDPGIEFMAPALVGRFFTIWGTREDSLRRVGRPDSSQKLKNLVKQKHQMVYLLITVHYILTYSFTWFHNWTSLPKYLNALLEDEINLIQHVCLFFFFN